jgi:hypothetical protein
MKIFLALGQRRPLDRQTAWGCFTTNLALPGSGSLFAGRIAGYFQLGIALAGIALTTFYGARFMIWFLSNWTRLQQPPEDPLAYFLEIWLQLRVALLGIAVFAVSWLWGLASGIGIVRESKATQRGNQSP